MASGRMQKIRQQKRQEFRDRQSRNRITAALNQQPYTVTDTDTLQTIASNNGVDPLDILQANPELKNVQTGMVLNVPPRPGSDQWRAQNVNQGGVGLPSNAALGGTTNNPQGSNYFQSEKLTTTDEARRTAYNFATPPAAPSNNWFANNRTTPRAATGVAGLAQSVIEQQRANPTFAQPAQPARPRVINTAMPPGFQNSMMEENYHYNLLRKVNSPTYTPSEADLNYLQHVGLIKKKPPTPAYVSGGGYRRGGGGRGGGSKPPTGKAPAPQERMPAFSSGSGFGSLINWRI